MAVSPHPHIVNIFERINRTGVSLSLFDLAGARLYLKDVRLRDLWEAFTKTSGHAAEVVKPESVLRVIAVACGKEPRKGNLLDVIDALQAKDFLEHWQEATHFLVMAHDRLVRLYGAFHTDWIPYTTILVPLAATLRDLQANRAGAADYAKLDRWYWASVFSQRYDSAVDTKTYQDVRDLRRWVAGGAAPDWLRRLTAQELDLTVGESRSALYRGLMCLIALRGARDFLTGQPAKLHMCHDDHIFPRAVYGKDEAVDTILNRSLISEQTNRHKQHKRPSVFVQECLRGHGDNEAELLKTLDSHFISREAYRALKQDDFGAFVQARREALARAVQASLG